MMSHVAECPHCRAGLTEQEALTINAKAMAARKRIHTGGRPSVLRPCRYCRAKLSATDLRAHEPHCARKPR